MPVLRSEVADARFSICRRAKIRVIQQETGGAFGGKEEYPSMIAGHAALLAWKSAIPVKLIYDREEDMAATTKRHPSRTRHKTAIAADGTLLAMDIEFTIDGGAYATLSARRSFARHHSRSGPLSLPERARPQHRGGYQFSAPWRVSRIRRAAKHFALERHMDKIARALDMEPAGSFASAISSIPAIPPRPARRSVNR